MAYYIDLTDKQMERLKDIVAYHIDIGLQKEIDKAINFKRSAEVERLCETKRNDQQIYNSLLSCSKVTLKEYTVN